MGYFFICDREGAMKKIFVVLAAVLLLAIMACSGTGGDSAGSSSQGSGTVGSTGGSVEVSNQTSPIYGTKPNVLFPRLAGR